MGVIKGLGALIILIMIIKQSMLFIVVPYMIAKVAIIYKEETGECPPIEVDEIVDRHHKELVDSVEEKFSDKEDWIYKYVISPYLRTVDVRFWMYKKAYHWRSKC